MKKNVGKALKSTTNNDNESSEEVDEDEEMEMFGRRFKRFMRSKKGREFQKNEGFKLESTREKYLISAMSARNQDTLSMIVLNLKRRGLANKRPMLLLGEMKIHLMMK
ncbi:hypothetical protein J1N35_014024 [Gossypium stocksii]|uniref:Uncharacterized protein n=1 Tax=Gossypium stocksii TaxID=47602 RepID=A0A9D3VUP5_9ROSI|nr:hypothetical protein J1N35_014024 [Gossypium stocksii]